MESSTSHNVTRLLADWSQGDREALDRLMPLVYDELRRLADSYLRRERRDHTLQPTALVHEAFVRLVGQDLHLQNRAHFFGVAAQVMRCILVDHARARLTAKRGGEAQRLSLEEAIDAPAPREVDLIALDDALTDLARFDPQQARIVELRYFGGLTIEEVAQVLDISPATVKREWHLARTWLHREIGQP
jgi:RNA polymerase sigma factor (TIGR02999 family)